MSTSENARIPHPVAVPNPAKEAVADRPVNSISKVELIDNPVPTLEVTDCPVNPITSAGDKDPKPDERVDVVGITIGFEVSSVEPKEAVNPNPEIPITSAGVNDPTEAVAD